MSVDGTIPNINDHSFTDDATTELIRRAKDWRDKTEKRKTVVTSLPVKEKVYLGEGTYGTPPAIDDAKAKMFMDEKTPVYTAKKWPSIYPARSGASYYYDKGYMQPNHMTRKERFPIIFDRAKELQPQAKRVLSFGCSTGEEAQALALRFPDSEIVGVDIDYLSVQKARKDNKSASISFHDELSGLGKFDLVTALMVFFCMEQPIPKDTFKDTLAKLNKHINPGGVLMIYTSDYDPKEVLGDDYNDIKVFMREHNKNKKQYFNGYYRKRHPWYSRIFG